MATQEVRLQLGEKGSAFAARFPGQVRVQHQPAGVTFYDLDWDRRPKARVTLDLGAHAFSVDHVLGVSTMQEDGPLASEGLYEFTVNAGISEPELIGHDEARLRVVELLTGLLAKGWRPVVPLGLPRLSGQKRLEYALGETNFMGLDARHVPTFEQWMRIPNRTGWRLYAAGVYLTVHFTRERTLLDPLKPGSYLITFTVQTEAEQFRSHVDSEDRPRWREVVPAELRKLEQERAKEEARMTALGVPLDETYQDPPAPR